MSIHKTEHVNPRKFKAEAISALIRLGWTQSDLAHHIGKSRPRVNQALNRDRNPRVKEAIRAALNLS